MFFSTPPLKPRVGFALSPLGWIVALGTSALAVAAVTSGGGGGSGTSIPADNAKWLGSPDEKNAKFYPPNHLFAPNGLKIVQRNRSNNSSVYTLTEYDSSGGIWQAWRMYDPYTLAGPTGLGNLIKEKSSDILTPFSGDFEGYTDWGAALGTYFDIARSIISFVPGVGAGVNFAISAGAALAQGKSLSDAVVAGVKASLPGGPLAAAAFDSAMALAHGASLSEAALAAAYAALPSDLARKAFDVGVAVARGQSIQKAVYEKLARSYIPPGNLQEFSDRLARGEPIADAALAVGGPAAKKAAEEQLTNAIARGV